VQKEQVVEKGGGVNSLPHKRGELPGYHRFFQSYFEFQNSCKQALVSSVGSFKQSYPLIHVSYCGL
jgi:hypothetical protein